MATNTLVMRINADVREPDESEISELGDFYIFRMTSKSYGFSKVSYDTFELFKSTQSIKVAFNQDGYFKRYKGKRYKEYKWLNDFTGNNMDFLFYNYNSCARESVNLFNYDKKGIDHPFVSYIVAFCKYFKVKPKQIEFLGNYKPRDISILVKRGFLEEGYSDIVLKCDKDTKKRYNNLMNEAKKHINRLKNVKGL